MRRIREMLRVHRMGRVQRIGRMRGLQGMCVRRIWTMCAGCSVCYGCAFGICTGCARSAGCATCAGCTGCPYTECAGFAVYFAPDAPDELCPPDAHVPEAPYEADVLDEAYVSVRMGRKWQMHRMRVRWLHLMRRMYRVHR